MNQAVAVSRDRAVGGISAANAARLLALLLPLSLLAGAYASQYFGGLYPCELCWYQRYAHFGALPFAVLAFAGRADSGRSRAFVLLAALGIAASGAIGVYHAGVEAKIFEGFTQCTADVKRGLSNAELLQQITHAPLVRCDEVQFRFLGLSMAAWNAIISLGGAALIAFLSLKRKRA